MICTSLHPPAVHPPDGMQAPLKIPTPYMLTAMLNNLDYTQGHRQNPVSRKIFFASCPAWVPGRTFTRLQQSFPPFDSTLEKRGRGGGGLPRAGKMVRERRMHAPDKPCLHRVLHELRLLPPGRQSGGRDRAEARHLPSADPQQWWSLRGHPRQRPDLLQEKDGAFPATRRGRAGAGATALRLIPRA
jgi:hypothetical protein